MTTTCFVAASSGVMPWCRSPNVDGTCGRRPRGRSLGRSAAGAGAAGGVGFGTLLLGARLQPGIELVLELVDFDTALAAADLVITGEGALDEQTLAGKAPAGVAAAARARGVPVVAVAGRNALTGAQLRAAGIERVYTLDALEPDPARSISAAGELVHRIGTAIGAELGELVAGGAEVRQ